MDLHFAVTELAKEPSLLDGTVTLAELHQPPEQERVRLWQLPAGRPGRVPRRNRIAARHPGMDPSGVYHVLCNLERTPAERLRNAFRHARLRGLHAR